MFFQLRKQVEVTGCQVRTIGWVGDDVLSKPLQESDSWRAVFGQALSWGMLTPLLNILLLRFWIARLSFVNVSQHLSAFIVVPIAMKSTINTPFRSQNTVPITLPADCAFRGLGKEESATDVILVPSQVWSGMPRFHCPWQSNPKFYPFCLHSGGEIRGQSPLVAVCGLLSAFMGTILRTHSNIVTCPSKSDKW